MIKNFNQYLFSISDNKKNLLEISGALIIIISFFLPWFKKIYLISDSSVFGAELLFSFIAGGHSYDFMTGITSFYVFLTAVIVMVFGEKKLSLFLSVTGIVLFTTALLLNNIPLENFLPGIWTAYSGLLLISLCILKKTG